MKRRTKGEGSIYKYTENGIFYYRKQIELPPTDGKRRRKTFRAKTIKELQQKINKFHQTLQKDILKKREDNDLTLSNWIEKYLYTYKIDQLRASSFGRYVTIFKNHIEPYPIARIKIKEIKTLDVKNHFQDMQKDHKTIATIKRSKELLTAALNFAVSLELISTNRAKYAQIPKDHTLQKSSNKKLQYLEKEDQEKVIANLPQNTYGIAILFNFATGLRIGELHALTWDNLDMKNHTITVEKTYMQSQLIDPKTKEKLYVKELTPPKTKESYRTIPYPEKLNPLLYQIKLNHNQNRVKYKDLYNDNGLVFSDEKGAFIDRQRLPRLLHKTLQQCNLPHMKYHAIRHCYATRMFEQGIDILTVSKLLGHKTTKVTQEIYIHITKTNLEKARTAIQNLV